nr:hypothetical protein [Candidatus Sigynarchaeota archaeon]
ILMIVRKARNIENDARETRIIKFLKQPTSNSQAITLARKIIEAKDDALARVDPSVDVTTVDREALHEFMWNWSVLTDLPGPLLKTIRAFLGGTLLGSRVAVVSLAGIKVAGEDVLVTNPRTFRGKKMIDDFVFHETGECLALREAGRSTMSSLLINEPPLERVTPATSVAVTSFSRHAGHVFIPESVRFNTLPLVASYMAEPAISSVGLVLDFHDQEYNKAIVAWMNSTVALIFFKPMVSSVFGNFGHVRGWHLKTVKVPDIADPAMRAGLASVYEKYKLQKFDALPSQYARVLDGSDMLRLDYDVDVVLAIVPSARKQDIKDALLSIYRPFLELLHST